jgi:hypothetical protein
MDSRRRISFASGSIDALIGALKQYHGTLIFIVTMFILSAPSPRVFCTSLPVQPHGW